MTKKPTKSKTLGRIRTRKTLRSATSAKSSHYDVGYKRPPKHTQFKPGKSGNPKGKPKGSKNFSTELAEELHQMVPVQEGGKTAKVSKQRVVIKALFAKAAKGDVKAISTLIALVIQHLPNDPAHGTNEEVLSDEEQAILNELMQLANRKGGQEQ